MDYDFHYYATKAASLLAGFEDEDAEIIAESALFVDYCDWSNFGYYKKVGNREEYTVQTSQFNATLDKAQSTGAGDPSIWSIFHFVPGNYNYNHKDKNEKFKLTPTDSNNGYTLCRPYSELATKMIEDTRTIYVSKLEYKAKLALIGIRMHVLADTWAHQNFTGISDSSSNSISGNLQKRNDSDTGWEDIGWSISPSADNGMAPNFISSLGHGAAGHLPDMGWLKFRYLPTVNQGKYVERDNPKEFKEAFIGLVCELFYIKKGRHLKEKDIEIIKNKSFLSSNPSDPYLIEIPQTILDMITKNIPFNKNTKVFKESAKQWEKYFSICKVPITELSKESNWEDKLIEKYKKDLLLKGSKIEKFFNYTYQEATITKDSSFDYFQKGAKWHLKHMVEEMKNIPKLKNVVEAIDTDGWSYNNSVAKNDEIY